MLRVMLATLLGAAVPALGQEAQAETPDAGEVAATVTETADETNVTSQVASFAITKLKDSPAVVTVLTGDDIRSSGARDLIDVLYLVPGFFFGVDVQGVVGPGFRGMWGYEGKILLLVDGKEMNELLYSTMQLGNEFPVELIERVEVVRGPGSVIYGGNAELAVINVVTKGIQGSTEVYAALDYGVLGTGVNDYARRGGSVLGRYVFDSVPGLSGFVSASFHQTQRSIRSWTDVDGNTLSMRGGSNIDPATIQFGIGYRDIQFSFLYHHLAMSTIDAQGAIRVDDMGTVVPTPTAQVFDSIHAEAVGTFRPTDRFEIIPRVSFIYQVPWQTPDQGDPLYYDKAVWRARARLFARWAPIDELQLTAGIDGLFDHASLQGPADVGLQTSFAGQQSIDYQTFGAFLELYTENPIINGALGARFEYNSAVGASLVPRVVLLRSFGPLSLKAMFSLAFRAPGIENLNLGTSITPERTRVFEFEAGLEITRLAKLSFNFFNVGISAPIVYSADPVSMAEGYFNLGKQGSTGGEASFRLRGKYGRVEANYALYFPTEYDNIANYQVPGYLGAYAAAPQHRAAVFGSFTPVDWLWISPTLVVLGPRSVFGPPDMDGNSTGLELPATVLANFYVQVEMPFARGLMAGVGVYNIFGTNYAFLQPYDGGHTPYPGLDREVMFKLSYQLEPN
ncbi:MAG: TonB-dependent receptor plug domain-containing protein [Archangiaceae bacterium]|nr:TonB-dependent receptor plug domain-containing protein [Archangiaceae bacterium]